MRCDDVTELDLKNLAVQDVPAYVRLSKWHRGELGRVNGSRYRAYPTRLESRDWKDSIIQSAPDVIVRFLVIHDSHRTGTGWRYYVTGLRCSGGKLQEVFHRDGMSLRVDRLDSTAIGISLDVAPGEPTRHLSFTWDRNTSQYTLSPAPPPLR